jgi:hypothetical protein
MRSLLTGARRGGCVASCRVSGDGLVNGLLELELDDATRCKQENSGCPELERCKQASVWIFAMMRGICIAYRQLQNAVPLQPPLWRVESIWQADPACS